ncbi:family 20 glycosylhydrolase [Galbibacter sp. EGI 63066]|uniref:beta-N-acetylhexosaminidase n=1 Tax=Galbibacter sp. EGI 63066 TaxID=2993559 RepID=UPI00224974D8|nr:family 20 glycosylhydrolase [Galbibacter sp. EGI 63066]MCX2681325.1 family 20 glycosylhydrolase [Galbibacter sp. EGI 63066]
MKKLLFSIFLAFSFAASAQDIDKYLINPPQELQVSDTCTAFSGNHAAYLSGLISLLEKEKFSGEFKLYSTATTPEALLVFKIDSTKLKPQGYQLKISKGNIEVIGQNHAGLFYAKQTLLQLMEYSVTEDKPLPCLTINDWPNIERRGFMMDVSRDKVPSMATLFQLIDKLSSWKINELQLYVEHTFAYKDHNNVWKDASPFTAEEIQQLDAYCKERFIDLVPNQNSFGHMENWLKHDEYLHLAECPDDCNTIWGMRKRTSLDPTNPESFALMKSLYEEFLPNFSSKYFNIGCDETVELGLGRSKSVSDKIGKGQVYLNYLKKLNEEVNKQGRLAQFWGDIILNHPKLIKDLPKNMTAMVWGYSADYPFDKNLPKFKDAGVDFYVCPGTSTWRSEIGRNHNAFENLKNAAIEGQKNGAKGFLNTNWGDYGHFQPLSVTYPTLLVGASYAWNYSPETLDKIEFQLNHFVFDDPSGNTAKAILKLGDAYLKTEIPNGNANAFHLMLRRYKWTMKGHYQTKELSIPKLEAAEKEIEDALAIFEEAQPTSTDGDIIKKEIVQAARLALHGIHLGIARLKAAGYATKNIPKQEKDKLIEELEGLIQKHKELWLLRNREGGLSDSASKLEDLLEYYRG